MISSFNLPVTATESVRVVYQKPDAPAVAKKPAPAPQKQGKAGPAPLNAPVADMAQAVRKKPVVIMLHDFPGGHKGACDDVFGDAEYRLEGLGFPTIRFDFRGCGESDGREEDFTLKTALEDLNAVVQWAQHDAGHSGMVFMGAGLGAMVAALGVASHAKTARGCIFLWPNFHLGLSGLCEFTNFETRLTETQKTRGYITSNGHKLGLPFLAGAFGVDMEAALKAVTVPCLIQHGTQDEENTIDQAYFGRDCIGGPVDLAIFEGGGHGLRAMNMRAHMFINIRFFLEGLFKKLDSAPKN